MNQRRKLTQLDAAPETLVNFIAAASILLNGSYPLDEATTKSWSMYAS